MQYDLRGNNARYHLLLLLGKLDLYPLIELNGATYPVNTINILFALYRDNH